MQTCGRGVYPWAEPLSVIQHHLLLQVFESMLSDEQRQELLDFSEETVRQMKQLANHTYLPVDIPDLDTSSPYAFEKYSKQQQLKYLAAFVAGIMTMPQDIFHYWYGPPLWGDGTSRWHWTPEGMKELLKESGFKVENVPQSSIYPPFVREMLADGTAVTAKRPYADPSIKE